MSNFFLAFDKDLHIIPVLNKVGRKVMLLTSHEGLTTKWHSTCWWHELMEVIDTFLEIPSLLIGYFFFLLSLN